jgi:ribonuclease HII
MPKADGLIAAVSAASIVAKVARDMHMIKLAEQYPNYGFENHVGYGTAAHRAALEKLGILPIHRRSFAPVARLLQASPQKKGQRKSLADTIGHQAEDIAAEFLQSKGHTIIDRNWKTKICEIDIISLKDDTIYFTEVKYRVNDRAGGGLAAIDRKKESQMRFAAETYLEFNEPCKSLQPILSVVALSGSPPIVENYLPNIN